MYSLMSLKSELCHLKAHFKTINLTLEEVLFVPESLPRYLGTGGAAGWGDNVDEYQDQSHEYQQEQDLKLHVPNDSS